MKKTRYTLAAIGGLLVFGALSLLSFSASFAQSNSITKDTIPQKRERKIVDVDDAIRELDKGLIDLEKELKAQDWKKIELDVMAAMKEVDVTKINAEVQKALKEVDIEKIKADVQKSLKELDVTKLKADMEASIAAIDVEKIKAEIEKVKSVDIKAMQVEMEKIKPQIEASMKEAKKSIEKAKAELEEYKVFIDNLEKDGLINKKDNYKIEHKNGNLIINDKTQSQAVYNKYRTFLEKNKSFTIKRDSDDFDITMD